MKRIEKRSTSLLQHHSRSSENGFTLVEVVIAAVILSIVVVGTFAVYTHAVQINRGNNLRAQALTVLQSEVEHYRSLRYTPAGSDAALDGGNYPATATLTSADGQVFVISVTIDNDPFTSGIQTSADVPEANCKFKEITISAVPQNAQSGWLADLGTQITVQRVRSN